MKKVSLLRGRDTKLRGFKVSRAARVGGERIGAGKMVVCYCGFENALREIEGRFVLRRDGDAGREGSVA